MQGMKKKLVLLLLILCAGGAAYYRFRLYTDACVRLRDTAAYYAEQLMFAPETANTLIPYAQLPGQYKKAFSAEQYAADTPEELLALYSNAVFQQNSKRKVSIMLSTDGYKKVPAGYFQVGTQWYYIRHEIDVSPNLLTLEPEIVRWNITLTETELAERP